MEGWIPVILDALATVTNGAGVIVVIFGVIQAVTAVILVELKGKQKFRGYEHAKRIFSQKMIFGLDFFVAADIFKLVVTPSIGELYILGATVAIRSVLSYFLSKEVHLHKE